MPGTPGTLSVEFADQCLQVDHLVWRDAELLHHLGGPDRLLLDRIQHFHARADQLHQILVGRDDGDLTTGLHRRLGIGRDQVVRFPILKLDRWDTERLGSLADQVELRDQIVWRRRAVRLVVLVQAVTERRATGVEDDGDMRADMLPQQLRQHIGETEHCIHRRPVGARHRRQCVVGAEDKAGPVNQDQVQRPIRRRKLPGRFEDFSVRWRGRLLS